MWIGARAKAGRGGGGRMTHSWRTHSESGACAKGGEWERAMSLLTEASPAEGLATEERILMNKGELGVI